MSNDASLQEYRNRIQRVVAFIEAHIAEDLPLEALADAACFSPFHFHRIFTLMTGETPTAFVSRVRLERAANLLFIAPSMPITAIALGCGFSSSAVFSRSFRKWSGISATQYRHNSKICKTESKIGKAPGSAGEYIEDVHNEPHSSIIRSTVMDIAIKQLPAYRIAYVANLEGYSYEKIDAAWRAICNWAGSRGLFTPETKTIGISFDNPDITPKEKCRYYACVTIGEDVTPSSGVGVMELPGGTHAVVRFEGPESEFTTVYRELYSVWLPESGFLPADSPCYEVYHSTPENHPEGKFIVDICLPIIPL